jgi:hypothetical protein
MSGIRTNAAAAMLGVSPNTLRSWERRFGFPAPRRSAGGHRQFELGEVEALREALAETHNVSSAIALARARGEGPSTPARLVTAFGRFDEDKACRLLEESLAVRSVERTVDEVLVPAVTELAGDNPPAAEYEFAWRLATGWVAAQRRLAPPASRADSILLFDATLPPDLESLGVQALELALRRAGARTLTLSAATDPARLGRALRALEPTALVLGGRRAALDTIGRLVYSARGGGRQIEIFDYCGALPETGASTVRRLAPASLAASRTLLEPAVEHEIVARDQRRRPAAVAS